VVFGENIPRRYRYHRCDKARIMYIILFWRCTTHRRVSVCLFHTCGPVTEQFFLVQFARVIDPWLLRSGFTAFRFIFDPGGVLDVGNGLCVIEITDHTLFLRIYPCLPQFENSLTRYLPSFPPPASFRDRYPAEVRNTTKTLVDSTLPVHKIRPTTALRPQRKLSSVSWKW